MQRINDEKVALVSIAQWIDHTKLTFSPSEDEESSIERLCQEAKEAGFYAVCVHPRHVAQAKALLAGTTIKVAAVIGFPEVKTPLNIEQNSLSIGNVPTANKIAETRQALTDGADELDIVLPVRRFKEGSRNNDLNLVRNELLALREAAPYQALKVILETDLLNPDEINQAVSLCVETGMDMVKTSTGMVEGGSGATPEIITMLATSLQQLQAPLGIKASGGVKTATQAQTLIQAGATRIGSSNSLALLEIT